MRILLTGGTGLIGRRLCESLSTDGHTVVAVSRHPDSARGLAAEVHRWNALEGPPPDQVLAGVEAVVNLAGAPIAEGRWTSERKKQIRDSRVVGTRNIVSAIKAAAAPPRILINGSAVGFYGNRGDEKLDESSGPGSGFLAEVCQQWEGEAMRAQEAGTRVVLVRTGVVLSTKGGALKKMLPPFKLGMAGPLGTGRQWFPWIHLEDIVGIIRLALDSGATSGPVNGVSPEPVTNADFTRQLARVLHRPAFIPAPEFALRLAFGEMATILLDSQRVVPAAALNAGYQFKYPNLRSALEALLG